NRDDMIWQGEMTDWAPAYSVAGIFETPPPLPHTVSPPPLPDERVPSPVGGDYRPARIDPHAISATASRGDGYRQTAFVSEGKTVADRREQEPTPRLAGASADRAAKKQVGGWLAFFCFVLIVLAPLTSLVQLSATWQEAQPAFELYPDLKSAVVVENTVIFVVLLYGLIVGFRIYSGHPRGKRLAQQFLRVRL